MDDKKGRKTAKQKKVRPASSSRRKRAVFWKAFLLTVLGCMILTVGAGLYVWKYTIDRAPDISALSFRPQGFATTLYDRDGNETERLVMEGANREEASYEEFPEDLVNAFIAIEDERFWKNSGIDARAILRAVKGVLTGDSSAGGGSTITQQLIKNTVFNGGMEKTFQDRVERKLQEQYLAVQLSRQLDKETIMTYYLNTINLGSNTLGVKVAARRYFDKELSELTLSECTVLAGITKNPSRLNPLTGPEQNGRRRRTILDKMEEQGMITGEQKQEALDDPVYERIQNVDVAARASASPYSYFTDEVINQVTEAMMERLGYSEILAKNLLYSGGLSIYTTQATGIQQIVDEEIANQENYTAAYLSLQYRLSLKHSDGTMTHYSEQDIKNYHRDELKDSHNGLYNNAEEIQADVDSLKARVVGEGDEIVGETLSTVIQPQVSFVLMDSASGEVLAVNGGRGEKEASRTLNRAVGSLRQPGSTFKVISAFAPALDTQKATLGTTYYDAPYSVGSKSFRNWYGNFLGYSNIREGIVYSMNILAVRCMMETISPEIGVEYAQNLGITSISEKDYNASTALGGTTDGVSNLELTAAYAAIANKGTYTKPVFFTKVLDHDGNVLLDNTPETHQALQPETSFLLTDALREAVSGGTKLSSYRVSPTGLRARLSNMSSAGKSGTTTSNKDLWFVGFTPYYTAGIWTGNDGSQAISGGTSYHKDIWRKIMERVHEGLPDPGFPVPDGVVQMPICRKSGKLAIPGVCTDDPRGNAVYNEYFRVGTTPTSFCDHHIRVELCAESGMAATADCPQTIRGVYLVLPLNDSGSEDSAFAMPERCPIHDRTSDITDPSLGGDEGEGQSNQNGNGIGLFPERGTSSWWDNWPNWGNRPGTEESRTSTESSRPSAEGSRPGTESSRASTESSRAASTESSRAGTESSRPSTESSRPSMESSRPSVENIRPSAESRPAVESWPEVESWPRAESQTSTESRTNAESRSGTDRSRSWNWQINWDE